MSRRILTLACAGLLLAAGTGCPSTTECTQPSDCSGGKTCVDNKCVDPSSACSPECSGATPICDTATKTCKACTATRGCTDGKVCDTSVAGGKCVECLTSQACGLELPVCDPATKTCVTCTEDEGCEIGQTCNPEVAGGECQASACSEDLDCAATPATPICDTSASRCVVCTAARGCTAPATCDTSVPGGQCKGCTANAQCGGATPVCDTGAGRCVVCTSSEGCTAPATCDVTVQGGQCKQPGCNSSLDCAATPATPVCDTVAHKCVVCTSAEGCLNGKRCDLGVEGGQCVDATCAADGDCSGTPATPICDTTGGKCVVCTAARGCTAPATCDTSVTGGQCQGCTASSQCTGGTAHVCDTATGKCVACTDTEGCDATEHCDTTAAGGPRCVSNGCTDDAGCTGTPATPTCDTATGKCVVCTEGAGCASPLVCDLGVTNGKCVDCLASGDCVGAKEVCDLAQKRCVTCTAGEGCAAPTPVCDLGVADGQCVACAADGDCAAEGKVCDLSSKTCATCTAAKGCAAPTPVCDLGVTGGQCVGCTASTHCDSPTPVCDSATKTCVVCTATDGCFGQVCQNGTACVDCLSSADCTDTPVTPLCDTARNKCVICTASEGCTAPQTCEDGLCVGCVSDSDCGGATPVCDTSNATCVVCIGNQDCGAGRICDTSVTGGECIVACASDTDCAAPTPACDTVAHLCVVCTDTSGCSGSTPKCKTGASPVCVQCLTNADCASTPATPVCGPSYTCVASGTDVSAQITAARQLEGAGLSAPIEGATVTYLRPAGLGQYDPPGFFVQGAMTGPALFVQVDPATLSPVPVVGDKVSFTVTEMASLTPGDGTNPPGSWRYTRTALAISGFSLLSQGADVEALKQDASGAAFPGVIADWENEYVSLSATLVAVRTGGTGWAKWTITTAGVTAETIDYTLRVPEAVKTAYGLVPGCTVNVSKGIVWRNRPSYDESQITAYQAADLSATCSVAPKVVGASAPSATTVVVVFDRSIAPATIEATGTQFTFDNGLVATAAAPGATAKEVSVTTLAQTAGESYTVSVAASLKDTTGAGVDAAASTATFLGWAPPSGCSPQVVISQVYGGGGNTGAPYSNDFVELHNRSQTAVDVTGWSLQYTSATGTSWGNANLALCDGACTSLILPAGGYFLIQLAAGSNPSTALPTPDLTGSIAVGGTNGKVALVASQTALSGSCPTNVVDLVGYGSADCPATNKVAALSNTTAAIRDGDGCDATFSVAAPAPRNSATTAKTCGCD